MLDIGWSELAVVAVLALVVIGPKDLPGVMRTMGQWMRKARGITREFQSSIDEMVREAELEDARKAVQDAKHMNVDRILDETVDPTGSLKEEAQELEQAARETDEATTAKPASATGDGGSAPRAEGAEGEAGEARATVITHPAQVAPPHSLTPPPEPAVETAEGQPEKAASAQKGA